MYNRYEEHFWIFLYILKLQSFGNHLQAQAANQQFWSILLKKIQSSTPWRKKCNLPFVNTEIRGMQVE